MSKYIDADKLEKNGWNIHRIRQASSTEMVYEVKKPTDFPAADVVEVVRCKDCKYQNKGQNECDSWNMCEYRSWLYFPVNDDDYCSNGERNE